MKDNSIPLLFRISLGAGAVLVAFLLMLMLLVGVSKVNATNTNNRVCFCHNINHNPHTVCTSNQGQISGHTTHVNNGTDTLGACVVTPPPPANPPPAPLSHSACVNNACIFVQGAGLNSCNVESETDCRVVNPPPPVLPPPPPVVTPTGPHSDSGPVPAPVCTDGNTHGAVANAHVLRNGSHATVNFFVTDGDSANVYYKEVGQANWTHAVSNVKVNSDRFGTVTINDLKPELGYTFGVQQVKGCSGGLITAVVVDGPETKLFVVNYYTQ